jgi:hypothetical protein
VLAESREEGDRVLAESRGEGERVLAESQFVFAGL